MNIIEFLEIVLTNETATEISLMEWAMGRYMIPMLLIILCLVWLFDDTEPHSYEPPHINLHILDSTKWKFAEPDYSPSSIGEEVWHLGINRNLIQLETMQKPIRSPLWDSLDSLLDQWEQDMTNSD